MIITGKDKGSLKAKFYLLQESKRKHTMGGEDIFGNDSEYCGDKPKKQQKVFPLHKDDYKHILESSLSEDLAPEAEYLITENHVFTTYEEAANAARELAIKKKSAVEIFINQNKGIYTIYDTQMALAIEVVREHMINNPYSYCPIFPLIIPRDKDILYEENGDRWHFVAHPNGTIENNRKYVCGCNKFYCGCHVSEVVKKIINIKLSSSEKISVNSVRQRDEFLNNALEQSKSCRTKVYVIRKDFSNEFDEYFTPNYVKFTEKEIKKELGKELKKIPAQLC